MKHTLINKHVLEALKNIPDESIDSIVTSPPYFGLRSYKGAEVIWGEGTDCQHEWKHIEEKTDWTGPSRNRRGLNEAAELSDGHKRVTEKSYETVKRESNICSKCGAWKGQLGLEPNYQEYLGHLMFVTRELKRVLKKSGTMFWNQGDGYSGSFGAGDQVIDGVAPKQYPQSHSDIPKKSLMMLPERFAMRMIDDGWVLRNKLIWYKRNAKPESTKDRFSNKYEFVYFFVKGRRYYFDLDAIRKPLAESSMMRLAEKNLGNQFQEGKVAEMAKISSTGNMKKALVNLRNKSFNIRVRDAQKGILKEKWGNLYSASDEEIRNYDEKNYHGKIPKGQEESFGSPRARELKHFFNEKGQGGNLDYDGLNSENASHHHQNGANPGDVLDIPTMPHSFAHFAIFSQTLVEPFIKSGCPKDGTVLDPFAGSGTVGTVARRLSRSSIQIEISGEYCKIIKERMEWGSGFDIEWELK